jgi:hypothetical protein
MDRKDQPGIRQVQFVVTAIDKDTARVENGTHGAIGKYGTLSKDIGKLRHSLAMLSQQAATRQPVGSLCYTSGVINSAESVAEMSFSRPQSPTAINSFSYLAQA